MGISANNGLAIQPKNRVQKQNWEWEHKWGCLQKKKGASTHTKQRRGCRPRKLDRLRSVAVVMWTYTILWHEGLIHVVKLHTICLLGLYRTNMNKQHVIRKSAVQHSPALKILIIIHYVFGVCFACLFHIRVAYSLHMHFTHLQNRQAFFLPSVPKHLRGHFPKNLQFSPRCHVVTYCVPRRPMKLNVSASNKNIS